MSRQKKPKKEIDTNSWLATYSDTITLLLTFFVLLYASSNADAVKFKGISAALQTVFTGQASNEVLDFNVSGGEVPVVGSDNKVDGKEFSDGENVEETVEGLKGYIKKNGMEEYMEIKADTRGYLFEIKDKILFETGKAQLRKESLPVLKFLGGYLKKINNEVIIEGHTDNVPIHNSDYSDNLALSSDRANNVTRYFINTEKLSPKRFRSTGLGEYHPIVSNNSDANRAKNRRVNILIVTESKKEGK